MSRRFEHALSNDTLHQADSTYTLKNGRVDQFVNESNFSSLALQAFSSIDVNNDGILQKKELQYAADYNVTRGPERQAVNLMLDNFEVVESLSGELPIDKAQKNGISRSDLAGFDKIRAGETSFLHNYAMSNVKEAAYYTSYVAGALSPFGAIGLTALHRGAANPVLAAELVGCVAGVTLLGMAGAAGYSYYKYNREQAPKISNFLNELNASNDLKSRI